MFSRLKSHTLFLLVVLLLSASPALTQTFFGVQYGSGTNFMVLEPSDGSDFKLLGFSTALDDSRGVAMDPVSGTLYAINLNSGGAAVLYTVDVNDGSTTLVGTVQSLTEGVTQPPIRDITLDDTGRLWGIEGGVGAIYPINKATGIPGTAIATTTGSTQTTLAFNPADDLLYAVSRGGGTYHFQSIDPTDGSTTTIALSGDTPPDSLRGMTWDPIDDVFRMFDNSGNYLTLTLGGVLTDTGNDNPSIYFGLAYDQSTTVPVELQSFSID